MLGCGTVVALGAQAPSSSTPSSRARVKSGMGIDRREDEGADVGTGVVGGDPKEEREDVAGILRGDDRVHLTPRRRVAGIEVAVVIGPHLLDRALDLGVE